MTGPIPRTAPAPRRRPLAELPFRPAVRRWARATVAALEERLPPRRRRERRLLAIFVDGLGASTLARAGRDRTMRFLPALRDAGPLRETRTFSGMPSTTAAFQAGLFYGLRHPDVPAFSWLERGSWRPVRMNDPAGAEAVERRIARVAGPGMMRGGASYLSILRGGAGDHLNTAGVAAVLGARELPRPARHTGRAFGTIHAQTLVSLFARLATETAPFLWDMGRFVRAIGETRHELNFLLNHLLVGTLLKEVAQAQTVLDLVRGVPRIFLAFHGYDEVAHRRGPGEAEAALHRVDEGIEQVCAIAAELPDPPDVYVFSDHGQIASVPFERLHGCTFADWVRGARDGTRPPELPDEVRRTFGEPPARAGPPPPPRALDCGDYAHVYLAEGTEPLDGRAIVREHARTLARILACPETGLAVIRHDGGAVAFAGGRRVDPRDPSTFPRQVSARAVEAILEELPRSPASGDVLVYGAWRDGGCTTFSWELGSHGGPSLAETDTFLIHPADAPLDASAVAHGADLHAAFRPLYGGEDDGPAG